MMIRLPFLAGLCVALLAGCGRQTPDGELDAFLADNSADAWEKQVARLLASPHYGERMAVSWLDVARYADTVGYHGDQNSRIFPYRDYVIEAFNENKPFDQFTTEQLAGDLLPDATEEQRIATGFLRLNLMTREGGAQADEYMAKYTGDRIRAIGGAWLGLTTGCAECHDHKFDPITTRDFYSLGAFFNDIRQWGIYSTYKYTPNRDLPGWNNESPFPPEIFAPNRAMRERLDNARNRSVEAVLAEDRGQRALSDPAFRAWLESTKKFLAVNPTGWRSLKPASVVSSKGTAFSIGGDNSVLFNGPPAPDDTITLTFPMADASVRSILLEALPDASNKGRIGRRDNGKFTLTPAFSLNGNPLQVAYKQADRRTPTQYRNGYQSPLLEDPWQSAPAVFEEPSDAASLPHHAIYHLQSTFTTGHGDTLTLTIASADIGRIRVAVSPFVDPVPGEPLALRPQLASALRSDESDNPELTEQINHDPAHAFMNTGSILKGRPSMGSWMLYGLGADTRNLPGYVVMVSRGKNPDQPIFARQWSSGFLPSKFQGVQFQSQGSAVHYIGSPDGVCQSTQRQVIDEVRHLNGLLRGEHVDPEIDTRIAQYEMAFRMQTSVPELSDMRDEPQHILDLYGIKPGIVHGSTDELGYAAVENEVQVRDLHATLLHQLGIDHARFSTKFQGLDYKLTGVNPAAPVKGILL